MAADAAATAGAALDRVDTLKRGEGRIDLFAGLKGEGARGSAVAGAEYQHRVTGSMSAFARAWVGVEWDPLAGRRVAGEALAGVRLRW